MQPLTCQPVRKEERGFTLMELMVVLVIFGLMASVAILSFPGGSSDLEQDAQRFAARTAALRDNAILQTRPMAVQVTPSGYSFLERRDGGWNVIEDKPFVSTAWQPGVTASVGDTGTLLISFESTGLPSDQAEVLLRYKDLERGFTFGPMGAVQLVDAP